VGVDQYGRTATAESGVPSYWALRFTGGILEAIGWGAIVVSVAGLLLVVVAFATSGESASWFAPTVLTCLSAGLSGLVTVGLAQLLYCVRDIAINSYLTAHMQ
jgi:hypothetical protein